MPFVDETDLKLAKFMLEVLSTLMSEAKLYREHRSPSIQLADRLSYKYWQLLVVSYSCAAKIIVHLMLDPGGLWDSNSFFVCKHA